jgi:hypothetical protein
MSEVQSKYIQRDGNFDFSYNKRCGMSEKRGRGQPKFELTPDQRSQVKPMNAMEYRRTGRDRTLHEKGRSDPRGPDRRWVRGPAAGERWQVEHDVAPGNACCLGRNRNRRQGAPTRGNRGRGTGSSNRVPSSDESYKPDLSRSPQNSSPLARNRKFESTSLQR